MRWKEERREEYAKMVEEKAKSISKEGSSAQDRWENLVKCIWEVGKELKMTVDR